MQSGFDLYISHRRLFKTMCNTKNGLLKCNVDKSRNPLQTNIDLKLVNSLHGLLICEIGGLDCHVITTEYRTRAQCIYMYRLCCNALVHVIYSVVSGQYSYTISTILQYIGPCYFFKSVRLMCVYNNYLLSLNTHVTAML